MEWEKWASFTLSCATRGAGPLSLSLMLSLFYPREILGRKGSLGAELGCLGRGKMSGKSNGSSFLLQEYNFFFFLLNSEIPLTQAQSRLLFCTIPSVPFHLTSHILLLSKNQGLLYWPSLLSQRRQWHPTPVLLPEKSHGWRSLEGCSPWDHWELDMTERLHFYFSLSCIGEGNGKPLQCSCLENPRDGRAWWTAVYGVAQSQTRLKQLSAHTPPTHTS